MTRLQQEVIAMRSYWKSGFAKVTIWLTAEILLNLVGVG